MADINYLFYSLSQRDIQVAHRFLGTVLLTSCSLLLAPALAYACRENIPFLPTDTRLWLGALACARLWLGTLAHARGFCAARLRKYTFFTPQNIQAAH